MIIMNKTMIVLIILLCLLLFSISFLIGYTVLAPNLGIGNKFCIISIIKSMKGLIL